MRVLHSSNLDARPNRPCPRLNFLHFHAVKRKILPNNRLVPPPSPQIFEVAPLPWEILDPPPLHTTCESYVKYKCYLTDTCGTFLSSPCALNFTCRMSFSPEISSDRIYSIIMYDMLVGCKIQHITPTRSTGQPVRNQQMEFLLFGEL